MISAKRLAIIGTTDIAVAHLNAARAVGFDVIHVAGSPQSITAAKFAQTNGITNVWDDPIALAVDKDAWDAIIIASSTESMIGLVAVAISTGKPVLAEKPIGHTSSSLDPLLSNTENVLVGFNRRFYLSVQEAKRFIASGAPCLLHLELPESVQADTETGLRDLSRVTTNSTHGLDLINYVTGGLTIESVNSVGVSGDDYGRVLTAKSQRGDLCSVSANWNAPANFSLTIDRGNERFELRPLEMGALYRGMEVVQPTSETPLRTYKPIKVTEFAPSGDGSTLKPGFLGQCQALLSQIDGKHSDVAATLHDAKIALQFAEALISG
ncbi:MAG: Gfo/Idh/MocA family oxidoreductase [Acidimicrobiia bacterium]